MIGRVRRHRSSADDVDLNRLHVFIPGALASGLLMSGALLVADAVRKLRGAGGARRRIRVTSAALSEEVIAGAGASRSVPTGLRRRWVYGVTGTLALGIAVMVAPGATWNFLDPTGLMRGIAWVWALSLLGALVLLAAGVQIMRVAPEWVPVSAALATVGLVVRFVLGPESAAARYTVIVAALLAGGSVVGLTWRLLRRRRLVNVPPASRALLRSTPAGRLVER